MSMLSTGFWRTGDAIDRGAGVRLPSILIVWCVAILNQIGIWRYKVAVRSNLALKAVSTVSQGIQKKINALAVKSPYQAPKVVSFSIDGMNVADVVSYTGNG